MTIRPGTADDAEAIAALIASFQRELTDDPEGAGAEPFLASVSCAAEQGYLASERYAYWVAEEGAEMLGFIAMRDTHHLFHLFVARPHQRRGVAARLWAQAQAHAQGNGAAGRYTVNASLAAVPVYRAFGFEPAGEVVSVHGISFLPMSRGVS